MEYIPDDTLLNFYPKTLQYVRKTSDLDQPGAMDEAIDILESWLQKQHHFTKKDFSRNYLERAIVRAGGSVEHAKIHLNKICTARTLLPRFFANCEFGTPVLVKSENIFLPNLTKDYYRVYLAQNNVQEFKPETYSTYYKRLMNMYEYLCAHDYSNGIIIIYDVRNTNLIEFVKHMPKTEFGHTFDIISNCYGFKIKGIFVMSTSKNVDPFVSILKEIVNNEIREHIHVLKNETELYNYVDREILPKDYGGQEKSKSELFQKWVDVLGSKEYKKYITNMNQAKVLESD